MRKIKFITMLSLFTAAFLSLITAMIFHAVEGDNSVCAVIFAASSAGLAFLGIVLLLINNRGDRYENK